MIKRLDNNTLVEFNSCGKSGISWKILITNRATREVDLTCLKLKRIRKWETEYKRQLKRKNNDT